MSPLYTVGVASCISLKLSPNNLTSPEDSVVVRAFG